MKDPLSGLGIRKQSSFGRFLHIFLFRAFYFRLIFSEETTELTATKTRTLCILLCLIFLQYFLLSISVIVVRQNEVWREIIFF